LRALASREDDVRRGDTGQPYDCEKAFISDKLRKLCDSNSELTDIPFQVSTAGVSAVDSRRQVRLDLQIDPARVEFRNVRSRYTAKVAIAVFDLDADDKVTGEAFWKLMEMRLEKKNYQELLRSTISHSALLILETQTLNVAVVVYDVASRRVGLKQVRL